MKRAGIESFEARLDELFERIAPALALPGDIVAIVSDVPNMPALGLRLSGNNVMAFAANNGDGGRCGIGPYTAAHTAWRVI